MTPHTVKDGDHSEEDDQRGGKDGDGGCHRTGQAILEEVDEGGGDHDRPRCYLTQGNTVHEIRHHDRVTEGGQPQAQEAKEQVKG